MRPESLCWHRRRPGGSVVAAMEKLIGPGLAAIASEMQLTGLMSNTAGGLMLLET
jgi:hypothetical protein